MQTAPALRPRIWFSEDEVTAIAARRASGHAITSTILARAATAAADPAHPHHLGALLALGLAGDGEAARRAADHVLGHPPYPQDLGLAHHGMSLAQVAACGHGQLGEARSAAIADAAAEAVRRLRHATSSHNPHAVQNNWWAVTHGGILLAAMTAHARRDHGEEIRWALGRILAFCQHFGANGLYHEGLGYQGYTLSHLLPALAAADRNGLIDLRRDQPWVTRMAGSLYAFSALRPARSDSEKAADGFGMMLSWNDAGLGWWSSNVVPLMLAYADPAQAGDLAAWARRLDGPEQPAATICAGWEGWPFALAWPHDAPGDPARLPRAAHDPRQGLCVFRDAWQGTDDALLGCYARATHVGGHSHDDGGSVRFMALDHDWILGGGQARGDARWQSVVVPADHDGSRKAGLGGVIWQEATAAGGVFGMDLRKVSGAYHERYAALAAGGALGVPAVVGLLDLIDDHLGRGWTWRITTEPGLEVAIDGDGAGFTLRAADGAWCRCRFLGQKPAAIRSERVPDSTRTYSSGQKVAYPGRPVIAADFAARAHLAIHAVLAVGRGDIPSITAGPGADAVIGGRVWQRPFSAAVPAAFDRERAGTLARWPDGLRGA